MTTITAFKKRHIGADDTINAGTSTHWTSFARHRDIPHNPLPHSSGLEPRKQSHIRISKVLFLNNYAMQDS